MNPYDGGAERKRDCVSVFICVSLFLTQGKVELSSCQSTLQSFSIQFCFFISTILQTQFFQEESQMKIVNLDVHMISW